MKNNRLQELDRSNFEIVKGEPDKRMGCEIQKWGKNWNGRRTDPGCKGKKSKIYGCRP